MNDEPRNAILSPISDVKNPIAGRSNADNVKIIAFGHEI